MNHPRRFSFDFSSCPPLCPEENPEQTNVILFINDHKLRAHAIGHYANTEEMHHWRRYSGYDTSMIRSCIDSLRDMDCPFFQLTMEHLPPCNGGAYRCPHDDSCASAIAPLTEAYIQALRALIDETVTLPRFSRFSDLKSDGYCWLFSDQAIVVKMVWISNDYNVMTAFHPMQGRDASFREILDYQIRRIEAQARTPIQWCDETSWGLVSPHSYSESDGPPLKRGGQRPSSSRRGRYVRGGGRNWRQYLDSEP